MAMEYVYAALLLHRAGQKVNEDGIKKVLTAAGISPDESRVKALVAALSEVNIDEVLKTAAVAPVAPATPAQSQATTSTPQPSQQEGKKEEKKEEKEEEALAGLSALFG